MNYIEISKRLEDAEFLWNSKRKESAFILTFISFASLAKDRYPNLKDKEGFLKFFQDNFSIKLGIEYQGKIESIEDIFYKYFRCSFIHEGALPIDIEFIDDDSTSIRAGGKPEYILKIGGGWFYTFTNIVKSNLPARDPSK